MPTPEPELAQRRKTRFKRTLVRMSWLSALVGLAAVAFVVANDADPSLHLVLATFLMAFGSMLVATFLMSLVFFSAQAGYDAEAHASNPLHDKDPDPR